MTTDHGRGGSQSDELAEKLKKPPRCGMDHFRRPRYSWTRRFWRQSIRRHRVCGAVPSSGSFTASSRLVSWVRQR